MGIVAPLEALHHCRSICRCLFSRSWDLDGKKPTQLWSVARLVETSAMNPHSCSSWKFPKKTSLIRWKRYFFRFSRSTKNELHPRLKLFVVKKPSELYKRELVGNLVQNWRNECANITEKEDPILRSYVQKFLFGVGTTAKIPDSRWRWPISASFRTLDCGDSKKMGGLPWVARASSTFLGLTIWNTNRPTRT